MRILYGVVGEGMGHAMRSRVVLERYPKPRGPGRGLGPRARLPRQAGLRGLGEEDLGLHPRLRGQRGAERGALLCRTSKGALGGLPKNIRAYFELSEEFKPDVVISDFETWSYLFGMRHGLPVISVDNMQIINRCAHAPELLAGREADFRLTNALVKAKLPGAFHYLITTFFYPPTRKPSTSLHPPILRPEILAARPEPGQHLLVYQTSTSNTALPEILKRSGRECRIYGLRRDIQDDVVDGNLRFRPFSETTFIDDLRTAAGVVASAGFTLMGEAVYLHRPMLAVPIQGQFEQVLNARYLEREGYGLAADAIDDERLGQFIERLPDCERRLASYGQEGNKDLLSSLERTLEAAAQGKRAPTLYHH